MIPMYRKRYITILEFTHFVEFFSFNKVGEDCYHSEKLVEGLAALKQQDYDKYGRKLNSILKQELVILGDFLLHTIEDEAKVKIVFALLEGRAEKQKSSIICSQRAPENWKPMIMNDEISANSIVKRATEHYTVMIKSR